MKKIVAMLLLVTLVFSAAGCGKSGESQTAKDDTAEKKAEDILNDTWAKFGEDEKFAAAGGAGENMVQNCAGTVDAADAETLDNLFGFPAGSVELIDDAASLMHMMNQNTFTAGAYHLIDAEDLEDTADALKENVLNRQWVCGFPDDLVVYSVGEHFLVAAFGAEELIDAFETHLTEAYESATLLYDEDLTF